MRSNQANNIWLFAESKDNRLLPVFYECLTKAKSLANEIENSKVSALILGNHLDQVVMEALEAGVDQVYFVDDEKLRTYNSESYAIVIKSILQEMKPLAFLFGGTSTGYELAPCVAGKMKIGLAAHCVDILADKKEGMLSFVVPAFGGKIEGEILIPEHRPQMATVASGIFEIKKSEKVQGARSEKLPCPELPTPRVTFVSHIPSQEESQNLELAELVIGCGRGVGTDENFAAMEKLAKKLNGAIAFTRPAIDMGWAADDRAMVGSSGKSVGPKVYLGFGISGATHHVSGIKKSDTIISVNKDEKASMLEMSDYKVVADAGAIINALLAALE